MIIAIAGYNYYNLRASVSICLTIYQLLYFIREKCISPFVGTVAVCTNVLQMSVIGLLIVSWLVNPFYTFKKSLFSVKSRGNMTMHKQ